MTDQAVSEGTESSSAFGPFEVSFLRAAEQLQRSATILVTGAITDWAAKLGIAPAEWLECYEPEVSLEPWQPGEDSLTLKLRVMAKQKGTTP